MKKRYGTGGRISLAARILMMGAVVVLVLSGMASAEILTDPTGDWFTGNGNPATGYDYTDIISANIEQISPTELKATIVVNANIPGFGWHGYRWFLDTDRSNTTGQSYYLFNDIGADYWVQVSGNSGVPNPDVGVFRNGMGKIKTITNYTVQGNKVEITFSISDIGNPDSFYWIADSTDGVSVNDHAPNSGHGTFTVSGVPTPDITLPTISISTPSNGQTFTTNTITVTGTASDNAGLSKVEVKVGAGSWQLASGTTSWSAQVILSSGSNTIYARATDTSGNTNNASVTVTYNPPDTTLPTISISSPANGQSFATDTVTVSGTASDNIALSKVEVKIGAGNWQLASGTNSWSKGVTLSQGMNTISAKATDTSGNAAETSVTIGYTAPITPPPTTAPPTTVPSTTPSATKLPLLTVSQTSLLEEPEVGEEVLITVTLQNSGEVTARNIRLTEQIPSSISVSFVDGANKPGNLVTWEGELAPNRAHAITHTIKILEKKTRAIPVIIRYEDGAGNQKETSTTVIVGPTIPATPSPTKLPENLAPAPTEIKVKAPGFAAPLALAGLVLVILLVRRRL